MPLIRGSRRFSTYIMLNYHISGKTGWSGAGRGVRTPGTPGNPRDPWGTPGDPRGPPRDPSGTPGNPRKPQKMGVALLIKDYLKPGSDHLD